MAGDRSIVVATGNPGKLREFREVLGDLPVRIVGLNDLPPVPEPAEDGATFAENARHKAMYYARAGGMWALADDSGLVVDAIGGLPGVISARFAADELPPGASRAAIDVANNRKLLRELENVPEEQRTARFVCHLALSDGEKILLETDGAVEGRIIHQPRGENGFGYDPLFLVPQLRKTTAELPPDEKNAISHRGKAARCFAAQLRQLLKHD